MKNTKRYASLPTKQLFVALSSPDFSQRIICGELDWKEKRCCFITGNGTQIFLPFELFTPSGDGITYGTAPDFRWLKIEDYGLTICFGEYEVSSDFIISGHVG